jgi:hypothetical protein
MRTYTCARGYAVCNPDIRGVVDSEDDSLLWDRQEGRDCAVDSRPIRLSVNAGLDELGRAGTTIVPGRNRADASAPPALLDALRASGRDGKRIASLRAREINPGAEITVVAARRRLPEPLHLRHPLLRLRGGQSLA